MSKCIDVEFSLGLHNRTGKYFIGRDIIADNAAAIERVRYWRISTAVEKPVPRGLAAKLIGRGAMIEIESRGKYRIFDRIVPRMRSRRPVLHLDPFTVLFHRLMPQDAVLCHDLSDHLSATVGVRGYSALPEPFHAQAPGGRA